MQMCIAYTRDSDNQGVYIDVEVRFDSIGKTERKLDRHQFNSIHFADHIQTFEG